MKLEQLPDDRQEFLRNNSIKHVKIYYIRDANVSVCLLITKSNIVVARGISYCSWKDQFSKKVGREIAIDRAIKAIRYNTNIDEFPFIGKKVNRATVESYMIRGYFGTFFMANRYPYLTPYERKILEGIKAHP